jgi:peroxiredoxin
VQASGKPVKDAKNLMKDRWSLVVVFRPDSAACVDGMGAVKALQQRYGKDLAVVGVTTADAEDAAAFVKDHRLDFPVLADGWEVLDHFGIPSVDENHTYLVNPPGVVVVQGDLREADHILARYLRKTVAAR